MKAPEILERSANVVFALAAAVIAVAYVFRAPVFPSNNRTGIGQSQLVDGWESKLDVGLRIGPPTSPLTIVEFMDFQCPFCRRFAAETDSLRAEYPEVALVVVHFPLNNHRHAVPAAIAAECAARQSRFEAMYRTLFIQQDSLGVKPWNQFASDAGIIDLAGFELCMSLPSDSFPRIAAGRALALESGITGTPGVWVNGWQRPRGALGLTQLRDSARARNMHRAAAPGARQE